MLQRIALAGRHDPGAHVVIEGEYLGRLPADREHWTRHDRRDHRLEAGAVERQFALDDRIVARHRGTQDRGHGRDQRLRGLRQHLADPRHAAAEPILP
jgi:hypothetical protein